jgi:hypothetical protein
MIVSNIFAFPVIVLVSHLTSKGHSGIFLFANVISTILLWSVSWLAAGQWGARSYVMGWAAATCFQFFFLAASARKLTGYVSQWTDSVYLLGAFCFALGLARWQTPADQSVAVRSLVSTCVGSVVFLASLLPLVYARREECRGVYLLLRPKGET